MDILIPPKKSSNVSPSLPKNTENQGFLMDILVKKKSHESSQSQKRNTLVSTAQNISDLKTNSQGDSLPLSKGGNKATLLDTMNKNTLLDILKGGNNPDSKLRSTQAPPNSKLTLSEHLPSSLSDGSNNDSFAVDYPAKNDSEVLNDRESMHLSILKTSSSKNKSDMELKNVNNNIPEYFIQQKPFSTSLIKGPRSPTAEEDSNLPQPKFISDTRKSSESDDNEVDMSENEEKDLEDDQDAIENMGETDLLELLLRPEEETGRFRPPKPYPEQNLDDR